MIINTKQAKEGCSKKKLMGDVNADEFTGLRTPRVIVMLPGQEHSLTRKHWGAQGAAMPRNHC